MGVYNLIFGKKFKKPIVASILPLAARQEIDAGRLPVLNTDKLFLKRGEKIHYIDKAISFEEKTIKKYRNYGVGAPGLLKGHRVHIGQAEPIEETQYVQHGGILYVTNQRIVFQAKDGGFDKAYKYLTSVQPYIDACVMQFSDKSYSMIVADGNLLFATLQLIQKRRQIP
jgi:hypothetical protein